MLGSIKKYRESKIKYGRREGTLERPRVFMRLNSMSFKKEQYDKLHKLSMMLKDKNSFIKEKQIKS